jgi:WD40 repeat protein
MLKYILQGNRQCSHCVAISGDSKFIATGIDGLNGSIFLWCADTGQLVCTFQGHEGGVLSLDFKGQSTLVSLGRLRTIKVWALSDGEASALLHTLRGHTDRLSMATLTICDVKVSPDGMKIASASFDKKVMIWSVQSGKKLGP